MTLAVTAVLNVVIAVVAFAAGWGIKAAFYPSKKR
jgi:hypothetical protein